MGKTGKFNLNEAVNDWSKQIRSVPSFTESDAEQFKYDLLDMIDGLISKGLDEEEAFLVASRRYNKLFDLEEVFEKENRPRLQMRMIAQALSGVMIFFLLFFLMHATSKALFLALNDFDVSPRENMKYVYFYIAEVHLFIIVLTVIFYFFGEKPLKWIESLREKPFYFYGLYAGILCLVGLDFLLFGIIKSDALLSKAAVFQFNSIIDYSGYSFPFVFILCFVAIYKKYYTVCFSGEGESHAVQPSFENGNGVLRRLTVADDELSGLAKAGLKNDEALLVAAKRKGIKLPHDKDHAVTGKAFKAGIRVLLIVLSGVLFYFLLYYLMHTSSQILLVLLQNIKNNLLFSYQWTRWYIAAYHLIFIFFTVSVYIRDVNLVKLIERIKIKPQHMILIFVIIIVLACLDRFLYPSSWNVFSNDPSLFSKIKRILGIIKYSFPFLVFTCFLFLFRKYYRDNMKIG